MNWITALVVALVLTSGPAVASEECQVPASFIASDNDLARVTSEIKDKHRLDISVVGTGSSTLPGPAGASFAYPARLQDALRRRLPGNEIKVIAHVQSRQTTAEMAATLGTILAADKPALVIWQAGTYDAVNGIEPEEFIGSLEAGVHAIAAAAVAPVPAGWPALQRPALQPG